jgi:hypothetical protein
VASQWAGGAVRENEVLFSVFFVPTLFYWERTCMPACRPVTTNLARVNTLYQKRLKKKVT